MFRVLMVYSIHLGPGGLHGVQRVLMVYSIRVGPGALHSVQSSDGVQYSRWSRRFAWCSESSDGV